MPAGEQREPGAGGRLEAAERVGGHVGAGREPAGEARARRARAGRGRRGRRRPGRRAARPPRIARASSEREGGGDDGGAGAALGRPAGDEHRILRGRGRGGAAAGRHRGKRAGDGAPPVVEPDGRRRLDGRQGVRSACAATLAGVPPADGRASHRGLLRPRQDRHREGVDGGLQPARSTGPGMLPRRLMLKAAWGQLVYAQFGATPEKLEKLRESVLRLTKGWDQAEISEIVRDTLDDVIEPIVYDEALERIRAAPALGPQGVHRVGVTRGGRGPDRPAPRRRRGHRHAGRARRARPLLRPHRALRLRRGEGGGHPRGGRARRPRPRPLLGLLRLGHRHPDARRGRPPGGGEPRPRAGQGREGAGLAGRAVPPRGAAARPGADAGAEAGRGRAAARRVLGAAAVAAGCGGGGSAARAGADGLRPRGPSWQRWRRGRRRR